MTRDMTDREELIAAWTQTQAALPGGWQLDSFRCAWEGLAPHERSNDWIAVARDLAGDEVRARGTHATTALRGLLRELTR
jgi:hypothetical protein